MSIPSKFTFKYTGAPTSDVIYLAELQKNGFYSIQWPKKSKFDSGETTQFHQQVEQHVKDGLWKVEKNLDPQPELTFTEKCRRLGLSVDYDHHKGGIEVRAGIVGGVSVNGTEGLNELVNVLYKHRVG